MCRGGIILYVYAEVGYTIYIEYTSHHMKNNINILSKSWVTMSLRVYVPLGDMSPLRATPLGSVSTMIFANWEAFQAWGNVQVAMMNVERTVVQKVVV